MTIDITRRLEYGLSAEAIARRISEKPKRVGSGWRVPCIGHGGKGFNLDVSDGDKGAPIFKCWSHGCDFDTIRKALAHQGIGVGPRPESDHDTDTHGSIATLLRKGFRIIAEYEYRDEAGQLLYQNVRLERQNGRRLKTFRQRRPDGHGGWIQNLIGVRRVPYLLPELVAGGGGQAVHVCEGEKDADRLRQLGLVATSIAAFSTIDLSALSDRIVYIHEDNDQPGRHKSDGLLGALKGIAIEIYVVRYPDVPAGGDVSDWLDQGHQLEALLERVEEAAPAPSDAGGEVTESPPPIDWLDTCAKGKPDARSQANIRTFLAVRGAALAFNLFSLRTEITLDGCTSEFDDAKLRQVWLEADARGLRRMSKEFFGEVCLDAARQNPYHPVVDWLDSLEWDGVTRIGGRGPADAADAKGWLTTYAGAQDTALNRAIGRAVLVAAVRRIRHPGSKFDNCLVLEGEQYAGKSTLVRTLAGDHWFSDSLQIGTDPKDTIEQTAGKWFCELAELAGASKKGRERVKAFLSRSVDRAALKWEKMARDAPRQFICVGTVNPGEYVDDPTGNRRFWICAVNAIDIKALRRDRAMIWAEASSLEASGESTELPLELLPDAAKEQEKRVVADPFYDLLEPVLEDKRGLVAKEDLWHFLKIEGHRQDPHMSRRLTDAMQRLGFTKPKSGKRRRYAAGESKRNPLVPCFERDGWGEGQPPWIDLPGRVPS